MNAVDTNVLLYALDRREKKKQPIARELLSDLAGSGHCVLLWQAACEFVGQARRWESIGVLPRKRTPRYIGFYRNKFGLTIPTPAVLVTANRLFETYSRSHWDSLLVAACIEAGVDTLYTEDMGATRQIESVQLVNPFVP
ncbi:MAG: PIN domain-containing protein [Pirellulales bacterium]